jgi:hypothetical protein
MSELSAIALTLIAVGALCLAVLLPTPNSDAGDLTGEMHHGAWMLLAATH